MKPSKLFKTIKFHRIHIILWSELFIRFDALFHYHSTQPTFYWQRNPVFHYYIQKQEQLLRNLYVNYVQLPGMQSKTQ